MNNEDTKQNNEDTKQTYKETIIQQLNENIQCAIEYDEPNMEIFWREQLKYFLEVRCEELGL
jgi:hypothetical protein